MVESRDVSERDLAIQNAALRLFLSAIERSLRQCSPGAGAKSRLGAVVFIHRFGALLNAHLHFHCVVEGVFDAAAASGAVFHPAIGVDAPVISTVQEAVRQRLLRVMTRRGLLEQEDAQPRPWPPGNTAAASR